MASAGVGVVCFLCCSPHAPCLIENVPAALGLAFGLTTAAAVLLFYRAARNSRFTLGLLLAWLLVQAKLGLSGFYTVTSARPPRLLWALGPALLLIAGLLFTSRGRAYLDALRPDYLTLLHTVRVPVELVLLGLFFYGAVPRLMTFEGRNWDILSGLSAPLVYMLAFRWQRLGSTGLLLWNVLCLGLLFNIVGHAVLAAPSPVQQLAFEQPNVAVLYFPFQWLPSCVVPLVLVAHLAAIRQLLRARRSSASLAV
ncbi:hypothetical protein LGH70_01580 [Hymenobacter sp. BT635]|uniref:CPBP family intramembrane metalloprotease n=1 Tax=Hymenobacter nitidus TaxID=2880929 RepID=A0ABS8A771_9BACT|nr:hypothetical protein [Hymenobacter nitidus]MCB2376253.1 hypothetical protein [Hymenobacter nitidus]